MELYPEIQDLKAPGLNDENQPISFIFSLKYLVMR